MLELPSVSNSRLEFDLIWISGDKYLAAKADNAELKNELKKASKKIAELEKELFLQLLNKDKETQTNETQASNSRQWLGFLSQP